MVNTRKLKSLIIESLENSLETNKRTMTDDAFDSKVNDIMEMIGEAVEESCKSKTKKSCKGTDSDCQDIEETGILDEGASVEDFYMATEDTTLGDADVEEGEFVEIVELDLDSDNAIVNIYDVDGEIKEEDVVVAIDEIEDFADNIGEFVDLDDDLEDFDDDEISEGTHVKNGKKIKLSNAIEKLKQKTKKGFVRVGKKFRKMTAKEKSARKRNAKKLNSASAIKKRAKSLKKSAKINSSASVVEGFDIALDGATIALESGDIMSCNEGTLTVTRNKRTIASDVEVAEDFWDKCIAEGVIEEDAIDNINEGSLLTYDNGFYLVSEGTKISLGNRIRAKSYLRNENYNVTSEMLDNAIDGEIVVL